MPETGGETAVARPLSDGWVRQPAVARAKGASRLRRIRDRHRGLITDSTVLVAAAGILGILESNGAIDTGGSLWTVGFPALTALFLMAVGSHRPRLFRALLDDLRMIAMATSLAALIISFGASLAGSPGNPASDALVPFAVVLSLLTIGRLVKTGIEYQALARGGGRRTLVIGAGRIGQTIAERLLEGRGGLHPVGLLDDNPLPGYDNDLPIIRTQQLERFIGDEEIEHAIFAFSTAPQEEQLAIASALTERGISVSVVPRLFENLPDQIRLERMGGLPLVSTYPSNPRDWRFTFKYAIDRLTAAVVIALLSPILIAVALAVRIDLGRPIFYRQTRVGLDNRPFEMLKFRSMKNASPSDLAEKAKVQDTLEGAFAEGLGPGGVEGNDRRTKLGALMRRSSLDELPQLLNVLKGDMSVVGPRPERPEIVARFEEQFHRYNERHRAKPGITGWAQVHGLRGRTSIADRVEWDNYYVDNWRLWLDLKIVVLTLVALVRDNAE